MAEKYTDTPLLTPRFDAALQYALTHHARQLRKGTPVPYAAHLPACASLVLEMEGDEDEAIGALLHDWTTAPGGAAVPLEDGGGREALERITADFGHAVAAIVLDNSDKVEQEPAGAGGREWYARKRAYVDAFAHKSPAAPRVSLADKLHNSRAILVDYRTHGDALWARFKQGQGIATRIYYRELASAFEREEQRMGPAAEPYVGELRRTVDAITALAEERQGPDSRAGFSA